MIVKRTFDLVIASLLLLVLSPLMLLIAALVRAWLGSPVLFIQNRPGKHGDLFKLYKFRTMKELRDDEGSLLPDNLRISTFGNLLRRSSLDELPELWNVMRGEMSLVGPRPLLIEYLGLYNNQQARRHEILPGITGWAQIKGRNTISWEEKFDLDIWYVDNRSLVLDIKILWATFIKVLKREGVNQEGHSTVEKFQGSSK